jgi:hypothetical protein
MKTVFFDEDFKIASLCKCCSHCVAIAHKDDIIAVRDTKDTTKHTLQFTKEEWQVFIAGVKRGEFDF